MTVTWCLTQRIYLYCIASIRLQIFCCRCTRVPVVLVTSGDLKSQGLIGFSIHLCVIDKPGVRQGDELWVVVRSWCWITGACQCGICIYHFVRISISFWFWRFICNQTMLKMYHDSICDNLILKEDVSLTVKLFNQQKI